MIGTIIITALATYAGLDAAGKFISDHLIHDCTSYDFESAVEDAIDDVEEILGEFIDDAKDKDD